MIVKLVTSPASGVVQRSHRPANQMALPSARAKRCLTLEPGSPVHS
jgi:hypothetical protein